jgi:hypothetical protein
MLPSGLPEVVADGERIARFLTSRGHFNSVMVKAAAFLPAPDHKKSVCRHGREPVDELRRLAGVYRRRGRTFMVRASARLATHAMCASMLLPMSLRYAMQISSDGR